MHCPDIGAVVDFMGRDGVISSVSGEEGDASSVDFCEHDGIARRAVWGVDFDFGYVFEEAVESGASEYANFCG